MLTLKDAKPCPVCKSNIGLSVQIDYKDEDIWIKEDNSNNYIGDIFHPCYIYSWLKCEMCDIKFKELEEKCGKIVNFKHPEYYLNESRDADIHFIPHTKYEKEYHEQMKKVMSYREARELESKLKFKIAESIAVERWNIGF